MSQQSGYAFATKIANNLILQSMNVPSTRLSNVIDENSPANGNFGYPNDLLGSNSILAHNLVGLSYSSSRPLEYLNCLNNNIASNITGYDQLVQVNSGQQTDCVLPVILQPANNGASTTKEQPLSRCRCRPKYPCEQTNKNISNDNTIDNEHTKLVSNIKKVLHSLSDNQSSNNNNLAIDSNIFKLARTEFIKTNCRRFINLIARNQPRSLTIIDQVLSEANENCRNAMLDCMAWDIASLQKTLNGGVNHSQHDSSSSSSVIMAPVPWHETLSLIRHQSNDLFLMKTSRLFHAIIDNSIKCFQVLTLTTNDLQLLSPSKYKLAICCQCQQIRSILRYEWPALVLQTIYDDKYKLDRDILLKQMPERALLDKIASIMSLLLRQFLVDCLQAWCEHIGDSMKKRKPPILSINMKLSNESSNKNHDWWTSSGSSSMSDAKEQATATKDLNYEPREEDLIDLILYAVDELVETQLLLPRIETELISLTASIWMDQLHDRCELTSGSNNYLESVDKDDPLVVDCKKRIAQMITNKNAHLSKVLSNDISKFITILKRSTLQLQPSTDSGQDSSQSMDSSGDDSDDHLDNDLSNELRRLKLIEVALNRLDIYYDCGLVIIDCSSLQQQLQQLIGKRQQELTRAKFEEVNNSLKSCLSQFEDIASRITISGNVFQQVQHEKRSAVSLLIEKINNLKEIETDKMTKLISAYEAATNEYQCLIEMTDLDLHEQHFELMHQLNSWPHRLSHLMRKSKRLFSLKRQKLTEQIKIKSSTLFQLVDDLHRVMCDFYQKRLASPLENVNENCEVAQKLKQRLLFLQQQYQQLLEEKQMFELDFTPDENRNLNIEQILTEWLYWVEPLRIFWLLANQFDRNQIKWMHSEIKRIQYQSVQNKLNHFTKQINLLESKYILAQTPQQVFCSKTNQIYESIRENLPYNVNTLRTRLEDFIRKCSPLLKILTDNQLQERHWQELSSIIDKEISPTMFTTLAQFLELGIEQYMVELKRLQTLANREHALDVFLKHMKSDWLEEWPADALDIVAEKFVESLEYLPDDSAVWRQLIARALVHLHVRVRQYLQLQYPPKQQISGREFVRNSRGHIEAGHCLTSHKLITPPLFIEFVLRFRWLWRKNRSKLEKKKESLLKALQSARENLAEIDSLVNEISQVYERDLLDSCYESEELIEKLEQETVGLELEQEILAADEAKAMEKQQAMAKIRDDCISQLTHRAIPAIRAAARALSNLDESSLKTIRCMKPQPPEAVKMVIEAVCILRSSCFLQQQTTIGHHHHHRQVHVQNENAGILQPDRKFDSLTGKICLDYWRPALKMIQANGVNFLDDLKRLDKKSIPPEVMQLIRERYLQSSQLNLHSLASVSVECQLLAKWLHAVDIFDRVINVVKPNYKLYVESEKKLSELLTDLNNRRHKIDKVNQKLQRVHDVLQKKIRYQCNLARSVNDCQSQLTNIDKLKQDLLAQIDTWTKEMDDLNQVLNTSLGDTLLQAAYTVYVRPMSSSDRILCLIELQRGLLASSGNKIKFNANKWNERSYSMARLIKTA